MTAPFVYARILGTREDEAAGYAPAELDAWAARAQTWAAGEPAEGLETVAPPAAEAKAVNEARPAPTPANQISVASLISALVASFFRRLFGRA